jgi:hypothetical protein
VVTVSRVVAFSKVAAGQGDGSCSRNPLNEAVFIYQLRFQFAAFFRKLTQQKEN